MSAFADEEEEEYEEISDEEKLKIATHFLLSSPPGEVQELLGDVKNIIPDSVLSEDKIKGIFRTYNLDQQTLSETTGGDAMLVSKHGEIDDNHYVDPRAGKVYGFNHVTQVRWLKIVLTSHLLCFPPPKNVFVLVSFDFCFSSLLCCATPFVLNPAVSLVIFFAVVGSL